MVLLRAILALKSFPLLNNAKHTVMWNGPIDLLVSQLYTLICDICTKKYTHASASIASN